MFLHKNLSRVELHKKIRRNEISFGGNLKLKIYGKLDCRSGKRMNKQNRIFFVSEKEAQLTGYRPCGICLKKAYKKWKDGTF